MRNRVILGRNVAHDSIAVAFGGGDTIYEIDKRVESALVDAVSLAPMELLPVTIVAEGIDHNAYYGLTDRFGLAGYRLLIDPIDGTRGLMYDKRSAWFLAALAPDFQEETMLSDVLASVMVEIPTSKQGWADVYWATTKGGVSAEREAMGSGQVVDLPFGPSRSETLGGGFAQVSNFFPGTKRLASDLMERIVERCLGPQQAGLASVFEDQYISTGGQLVELVAGRDRFCCDLRPLFYRALENQMGTNVVRGLECHPYDLAGSHLARMAGVVITDGFGGPLNGPFDLITGMHWIGYSNNALRLQIEPVILEWLAEHGVVR